MSDHIERLRRFVESRLDGHEALRVLEAGCGSCSWFDLRDRGRIVGIDISAKQLARNALLHEAVQDDLMQRRFAPASFDLIVCLDVLEHLPRPRAALVNLCEALAPGGLLVLKVPNALSWKGIFTKCTPHGLHVWAYRRFLWRPLAGREDVGPFRTHMRWAIRPRGLRHWARESGLGIAYEDYYEAWAQTRLRRRLGPLDWVLKLLDGLGRALSLGELSLARSEYVLVLERRRG